MDSGAKSDSNAKRNASSKFDLHFHLNLHTNADLSSICPRQRQTGHRDALVTKALFERYSWGYNGKEYLMEEIFQKIIANDFTDVAGLTADASIPVSQSLANEIIAAKLQDDKTIKSCQVTIYEQNQVLVHLKTSLLPWSLNLKLRLDKSMDFASFSSPKMKAWLENNRLLGSLGSFFHALPEWVKLYGNQMVIDLGYFLPTPEQKRLFDLIKSAEVRTEEGRAIFHVKIEVDS